MPVLSEHQVSQIVNTIQGKLDEYNAQPIVKEDKEYMHGRRVHYLTGRVYCAFLPGQDIIDGFKICKRRYGQNNLFLPELSNDEYCIQLYGQGCDLNSKEIHSRLLETGPDRFHALVFHTDEQGRTLNKLVLVTFSCLDNEHVEFEKTTIYRRHDT